MHFTDIKTIEDVLNYWLESFKENGKIPDYDLANSLMGVIGSDANEAFYEQNKKYAAVTDYVVDLDFDQGSTSWRRYRWRRIERLITEMLKEHGIPGEVPHIKVSKRKGPSIHEVKNANP